MNNEILIVDDEEDIRMQLAGILEDEGYTTRGAKNSTEALDALQHRSPAMVILDVWLQGSELDGLQILERIRDNWPLLPVIMISGHGTIKMAVDALQKGAYDFIQKPLDMDSLFGAVHRATEASKLRQEVAYLKERMGDSSEIIGDSSATNTLRGKVTKIAPTNSRILIRGPAGSGKEVVARQIHQLSKRNNSAFVVVNCATLHPDRFEEELFGIDGGQSGPSAKISKMGKFEQANGGTLVLDEVADMPMATQGKIVRALQEQNFHRVGGSLPIEVDVRVLATTNRDLNLEIKAGRFREDLFYRLNVVPVEVPSLRQRREDIPELVQHFYEQQAKQAGLPVRKIGVDAMALLQTYAWPGNVRQLKNVVEWMLIMSGGKRDGEIKSDMLPPEIVSRETSALINQEQAEVMSLPLREARESFERHYLMTQITRFGGNISRTAEFVGMERSALHRKLKLLGVNGNAANRPGEGDEEESSADDRQTATG